MKITLEVRLDHSCNFNTQCYLLFVVSLLLYCCPCIIMLPSDNFLTFSSTICYFIIVMFCYVIKWFDYYIVISLYLFKWNVHWNKIKIEGLNETVSHGFLFPHQQNKSYAITPWASRKFLHPSLPQRASGNSTVSCIIVHLSSCIN